MSISQVVTKKTAYTNLVKDIENNLRFIYLNHLKSGDNYFVIVKINERLNYFLQAIAQQDKILHLEIPTNNYLLRKDYTREQIKLIKDIGWDYDSTDKVYFKEFDIMKTPIKQIAEFAAESTVSIFDYNFKTPMGYEVNFQENSGDNLPKSFLQSTKCKLKLILSGLQNK